jgi:mycothiol system anti-sigma-R factor
MSNPLPDDEASSWPCAAVVAKLYEFLDDELASEVCEVIRAHLAHCQPCARHFEYERVFLRVIAERTELEQAPPELRKRILRSLLRAEGEHPQE